MTKDKDKELNSPCPVRGNGVVSHLPLPGEMHRSLLRALFWQLKKKVMVYSLLERALR